MENDRDTSLQSWPTSHPFPAQVPEDVQDAFLQSELELKAELSRAKVKSDVEDRARVAERDLALASSALKTRDAELAEARAVLDRERERHAQALAAAQAARPGRLRVAGGDDNIETANRGDDLAARVSAAIDVINSGPRSPLFSDDAGGASPFLAGLDSAESSRFGDSGATELRQREIIAAMRSDLESIKADAARDARARFAAEGAESASFDAFLLGALDPAT